MSRINQQIVSMIAKTNNPTKTNKKMEENGDGALIFGFQREFWNLKLFFVQIVLDSHNKS